MKLKDFIKSKDHIEVVETYPFAIRNVLNEAKQNTITRHTGQTVDYHIDMELTTLENVGAIIRSNVEAPMTDWKLHNKFDSYNWIANKACRLAEQITTKMANCTFKCIDCWGVRYRPGESTKRHSHWPHQFAFSYYIKMPDTPAPITFPTANYEYNPKVGDLVLFPGWIQHEVKEVDGERIMVAGNLVNTNYDNM
tara:strand:- start:2314 stop:2898 length:585 start_codon:yes stop_codon:yes gene_type:complete